MVRVKICGITRVEDALAAVSVGADAIGLNFYQGSPRYVSEQAAKVIVDAIADRALVVGVFVNAEPDEIINLQRSVGFRCVQFHGREEPEVVARFLPHAYKALSVRGPEIIEEAGRYPGKHILLDAYVPGQQGGTGAVFDWNLAAEVAQHRHVTLAGGLTPENVAQAVRAVKPFCVDVASGVESAPGIKDHERMRRFVHGARNAIGIPH